MVKWFQKVVDERQELEMLRIERVGFYVLFFCLAVSILVQGVYLGAPLTQYGAEVLLLLLGTVVILVGNIRKGTWSYCSQPGLKSYLLTSGVAMLAMLVIQAFRMSLRSAAIAAAKTFVVTFALIAVTGALVKRSKRRREEVFAEEDMGDANRVK